MSDFFNQDFASYDWKKFKDQFKNMKGLTENQPVPELDLSWLDNYIETMLENSLPEEAGKEAAKKEFHYNLYETEKEMILRVPISPHCDPKRIKVWTEANQLVLAGITRKKRLIHLPSKVCWERSKAFYREGMLELRLHRDKTKNYREIPIDFRI